MFSIAMAGTSSRFCTSPSPLTGRGSKWYFDNVTIQLIFSFVQAGATVRDEGVRSSSCTTPVHPKCHGNTEAIIMCKVSLFLSLYSNNTAKTSRFHDRIKSAPSLLQFVPIALFGSSDFPYNLQSSLIRDLLEYTPILKLLI